jgi:hypothetical protein
MAPRRAWAGHGRFSRALSQWQTGISPVYNASLNGHFEVSRAWSLSFALSPASICLRGQDGLSPVHMASRKGHIDVVRLLIGAGADINAINKVEIHTKIHTHKNIQPIPIPHARTNARTHARTYTLTHKLLLDGRQIKSAPAAARAARFGGGVAALWGSSGSATAHAGGVRPRAAAGCWPCGRRRSLRVMGRRQRPAPAPATCAHLLAVAWTAGGPAACSRAVWGR